MANGATSEATKRTFTAAPIAAVRRHFDGIDGHCAARLRGLHVDVIFVEPCFPANQREFVRALASVGARVIGIGERDKSVARRRPPRTGSPITSRSATSPTRPSSRRPSGCIQGRANVAAPRGGRRGARHGRRAACARRCGIPGTSVADARSSAATSRR